MKIITTGDAKHETYYVDIQSKRTASVAKVLGRWYVELGGKIVMKDGAKVSFANRGEAETYAKGLLQELSDQDAEAGQLRALLAVKKILASTMTLDTMVSPEELTPTEAGMLKLAKSLTAAINKEETS